ncbi:MAG: outer membrane lipoprotein carrier protein LolA [Chthoniobacterales bacterium]
MENNIASTFASCVYLSEMTRTLLLLVLLLTMGLTCAANASAAERMVDMRPVKEWMEACRNLKTLSADITQSRSLKTLRKPIIKSGRFYFKSPSDFLWEIGSNDGTTKQLADSIVLRHHQTLYLIDPKKRQAKSFSIDPDQPNIRHPAQAMVELPLGLDYSDFKDKFLILDLTQKGTQYNLKVLPRDARSRKYLREISIVFDSGNHDLISIEILFRDGSLLGNTFSNVVKNKPVSDTTFDFDFTGYKLIHAND